MAQLIFKAKLPFKDQKGNTLANMLLVAKGNEKSDLINILSDKEALVAGEEPVQIYEGQAYQYELDREGFYLEEDGLIVRRFLVGSDELDRGAINPGQRIGLLHISLVKSDKIVSNVKLEVRSIKLGYRDDYRCMLEEIANASIDLILQVNAPTQARLTINERTDPGTIQQRFFFVKGLLESPLFKEAINQILSLPYSRLEEEEESSTLAKGLKGCRNLANQLVISKIRSPLPKSHPLYIQFVQKGIEQPSLPTYLHKISQKETVDTPENRFIKYVLTTFLIFISDVEEKLCIAGESYQAIIRRDIKPLKSELEEILSNDFFSEISTINRMPQHSTVLLRKEGYREIFSLWLKFNAAAQLIWSGGDDVFSGGKRDLATLYEYWLLFILWEIISDLITKSGKKMDFRMLLQSQKNGFGLKIKRGELLGIPGTEGLVFNHNDRKFKVQFCYNRTFFEARESGIREGRINYHTSYPNKGSWTRRLRPDFTISFWPSDMMMEDAEVKEKIVHIHFDAKYSVDNIKDLFGSETENLSDEKVLEKEGRYKRGDLLKMHTYRDAIRRSQGAYILYPGNSNKSEYDSPYHLWMGYHEILPGLGAFVMRPGKRRKESINNLKAFLEDILDHMASETTRESLSRTIYDLNKKP